MSSRYVVNADNLNFRDAPVAVPRTRIALLDRGQKIEKLGDAPDPSWWRVRVRIGERNVEGYVAHQYLAPESSFHAPAPLTGIAPIHLEENRPTVTRAATGAAWRHPLGEANRPRRSADSSAARVSELRAIVDWLRVDDTAHRRWQPMSSSTYCNIYAYDYSYLAGAYLPRVWWTGRALTQLANGVAVSPVPGSSVVEITANELYQWLSDFGSDFGWRRTTSLSELQDAANDGHVGVICARRVDLARSGHIATVVPESSAERARRQGGSVISPLQSQAGSTNIRYGTPLWWAHSRFRAFGFWHHP